jgi:hypothetical protein
VARTLERDWETALSEQARLLADHERFLRERPQAPSPVELGAIQDLTRDLPALWRAETTTRQERQTIARLLLERVIVTVIGGSEQVRLECHWHGGNRTAHRLARPVAKLKALSTYPDLVARVCELRRRGHNCVAIAAILNHEGWRSPKRRDTFNGPMVRRVLIGAGLIEAKRRAPRAVPQRRPDEWTINELAAEIGAPAATIYHWVQKGRLSSRSVKVQGTFNKLVTADAATIAQLEVARATPPPFRCEFRRNPATDSDLKPATVPI